MKRYEFHSHLPPEELKRRLDWEIAAENGQLDKRGGMKLSWRGMKFRIGRWDGGSSRGVRNSKTTSSFRVSKGVVWEGYAANPFRGEILSDGAGGSILRGRIVLHWGAPCLIAAFAAIIPLSAWAGHKQPFSWERVIICEVFSLALAIGVILRDHIRLLPGSRAILEFLERIFAKLEDG